MRKKLVKLTLAVSVLIGGLEMGVVAREASACPAYYCCDRFCSSVRYCYQHGSGCFCEHTCQVRLGPGGIE